MSWFLEDNFINTFQCHFKRSLLFHTLIFPSGIFPTGICECTLSYTGFRWCKFVGRGTSVFGDKMKGINKGETEKCRRCVWNASSYSSICKAPRWHLPDSMAVNEYNLPSFFEFPSLVFPPPSCPLCFSWLHLLPHGLSLKLLLNCSPPSSVTVSAASGHTLHKNPF